MHDVANSLLSMKYIVGQNLNSSISEILFNFTIVEVCGHHAEKVNIRSYINIKYAV